MLALRSVPSAVVLSACCRHNVIAVVTWQILVGKVVGRDLAPLGMIVATRRCLLPVRRLHS